MKKKQFPFGMKETEQLISFMTIVRYLRLVGRTKCLQSNSRGNILSLRKQSLVVTSIVLRLFFYICHKYFLKRSNLWLTPSLVCSNTLPLSLPPSLYLRYLALFPQSSIEYLTLCVQYSWPFNKCILQRVVLISSVALTQNHLWQFRTIITLLSAI